MVADSKHDLTFEELREVVAPIAKKYGAGGIYLFGSRARGDNSENSDYDFYVILGQIRGLKFCGLLRELEEALGKEVDLVSDGAQVGDEFIEEVLRDRRLVYEA